MAFSSVVKASELNSSSISLIVRLRKDLEQMCQTDSDMNKDVQIKRESMDKAFKIHRSLESISDGTSSTPYFLRDMYESINELINSFGS